MHMPDSSIPAAIDFIQASCSRCDVFMFVAKSSFVQCVSRVLVVFILQTDKKDPQGNGYITGFEVLLQKQLKGKQMQKEMAEFIRERYRIFNQQPPSFFYSFSLLYAQVAMNTIQLSFKQSNFLFFWAHSCSSLCCTRQETCMETARVV